MCIRDRSYIAADTQAKAIICGPEYVELLADLCREVEFPIVIGIEGAPIAGALSYEEGVAAADEAEPECPSLTGEDICCILYTSGTTGRPKGAMLPHRQIVWNCINTAISWGLRADDVSPVMTPMFHAGGLFVFLTPLFYVGGKIVLARGFDSEGSLALIPVSYTHLDVYKRQLRTWVVAAGETVCDGEALVWVGDQEG